MGRSRSMAWSLDICLARSVGITDVRAVVEALQTAKIDPVDYISISSTVVKKLLRDKAIAPILEPVCGR